MAGRKNRLDRGGFAYGEIPVGFERSRELHVDAPLSRRGKAIYYAIVAIVVAGGGLLIWLVSGR
jgi:hypothetical protein